MFNLAGITTCRSPMKSTDYP